VPDLDKLRQELAQKNHKNQYKVPTTSALPTGAPGAPGMPNKRPVSESGPPGPGFNRAEVNYDKYRQLLKQPGVQPP